MLVTGASGTVGKEVVSQLLRAPDKFDVSVFDIKTNRSQRFYRTLKNRVRVCFGDLGDKKAVAEACKGKDAVIHLAAVIPPVADEKPALAENVNVTGTRNLVEATRAFSPEAFFLYSSSISVYGDRLKNPWIKTGDPLVPCKRDFYAQTKLRAEEIIRRGGLSWTIFRLTAIMGAKNHGVSPLMFHMPLETKLEICTPADAARAFVQALEQRDALAGKVFNLGGGAACRTSYEAFIRRSFQIAGLGEPDFAPGTFAEKNFHCGYYADGDVLENILHFRRETLEDYFVQLKKALPPWQKAVTVLFRSIIKKRLQRASEPFQALKHGNREDVAYFFQTKKEA